MPNLKLVISWSRAAGAWIYAGVLRPHRRPEAVSSRLLLSGRGQVLDNLNELKLESARQDYLATVTVPLDRWSRSYPRAAVAPAMGSLREANFTKDLTPTDDPFLL